MSARTKVCWVPQLFLLSTGIVVVCLAVCEIGEFFKRLESGFIVS